MGQHQTRQLNAVAGRQRGGQHDVIAVAGTHHQSTRLQAGNHFGHRAAAQHGFEHTPACDFAFNHHLGAQMTRHVNGARRRQQRIVVNHTPDRHTAQLAGGSGFIETGGCAVKDDTHHLASGVADLGNQVIGLGNTLGIRAAGHQHHVGLQAAGNVSGQARKESPARIGMNTFDHQHVGPFGAGHGQADNLFQQLIGLAAGDVLRHPAHGQGVGGVIDLANTSRKQHRRFGVGRAFGHRFNERNLQSTPLQRPQKRQ